MPNNMAQAFPTILRLFTAQSLHAHVVRMPTSPLLVDFGDRPDLGGVAHSQRQMRGVPKYDARNESLGPMPLR